MPIAVIADLPGMTTDDYDRMMEEDLGDHVEDRALMHFAHLHGDGLRVVDIWPDRAAFDEFLEKVGPVAKRYGVKPTVEVVPVHAHFHKHHPRKRGEA